MRAVYGLCRGIEQNKEKFFKLQQEREFISLLIMNDTKKIRVIYRRIVKLATGSCEGTSGLRVEQQPSIIVFRRKHTKKKRIRDFL